MLIIIDNFVKLKEVKVRIIHAATMLESGLPFYQDETQRFTDAQMVQGGDTYAIIDANKEAKDLNLDQDGVYMIVPKNIAVVFIKQDAPEKEDASKVSVSSDDTDSVEF